jgi:hypothetical protein
MALSTASNAHEVVGGLSIITPQTTLLAVERVVAFTRFLPRGPHTLAATTDF